MRVLLPEALVRIFPGAPRCVDLPDAATVGAAIAALEARWPGMRDRLCDGTPAVRRHINIFVGGERATLETGLPPGAELIVMTAVSGG